MSSTSPGLNGGLRVSTRFVQGNMVVSVEGGLDHLNSHELGAALDAAADRPWWPVVLDLARCDFMSSAGLQVISRAAGRGQLLGTTMVVRSPSAMVRRLLSLTGLDELVRYEQPAAPGPDSAAGRHA